MSETAQLRWRCRRGMKELDVLLTHYLTQHYTTAPAAEQCAFVELLELQDPVLFGYFLGRETPSEPVMAELVDKIRTALRS